MTVGQRVPLSGLDAEAQQAGETLRRLAALELAASRRVGISGDRDARGIYARTSALMPAVPVLLGSSYATAVTVVAITQTGCKAGDSARLEAQVRIATDTGSSGFQRFYVRMVLPDASFVETNGNDSQVGGAADVVQSYLFEDLAMPADGTYRFELRGHMVSNVGNAFVQFNSTRLRLEVTAPLSA